MRLPTAGHCLRVWWILTQQSSSDETSFSFLDAEERQENFSVVKFWKIFASFAPAFDAFGP